MSELIGQPFDDKEKNENSENEVASSEGQEYEIDPEFADETAAEILEIAQLMAIARGREKQGIKGAELLSGAKDVLAELNPRVAALEDTAREIQELRKLPMLQAANKADEINIKKFSDNAGLLHLKLLNLSLKLRLVRINETDPGIKEQADQTGKEVNSLADRIKIADNIREIVHHEARRMVLAAREILGENE